MNDNGLAEVELEKNGVKIKLKKSGSGVVTEKEVVVAPQTAVPSAAQATAQAPEPAQAEKEEASNISVVKSPMVGTFYAAPSPDKESYVSKGQVVKADDVLCIVEAMKLMNEIKSEVNGKIVEILVENGQAVEFDQPLFKIQIS